MIDSEYFFIAEPAEPTFLTARAFASYSRFAVFSAIFREMSFSEESYQAELSYFQPTTQDFTGQWPTQLVVDLISQ